MKTRTLLFLSAFLCLAASSTQANLLNFDDVVSGTTVTNQYPEATFTSTTGNTFRTLSGAAGYGSSAPNVIAGYNSGGTLDGTLELFVTFASPVNGLSFKVVGDNNVNSATIDVFVNNALSSTFALTTDGSDSTADLQNLSSFSGITSIHVYNVTDNAGIGYDDFSFTAVPEPSTWAMLAFGTGVGAYTLRRRAC